MIAVRPTTPEIEGYDALLSESLREGHRMLQRLDGNWRDGSNRFSRPGEILLGAFVDDAPVGICGRSIDPYAGDPRAGRVRHLYVHPGFRRHGIGRLLVRAIVAEAGRHFDCLNTRAPGEAFPFYESLGFARVGNDANLTHRLMLEPPRGLAFTRP